MSNLLNTPIAAAKLAYVAKGDANLFGHRHRSYAPAMSFIKKQINKNTSMSVDTPGVFTLGRVTRRFRSIGSCVLVGILCSHFLLSNSNAQA